MREALRFGRLPDDLDPVPVPAEELGRTVVREERDRFLEFLSAFGVCHLGLPFCRPDDGDAPLLRGCLVLDSVVPCVVPDAFLRQEYHDPLVDRIAVEKGRADV